MTDVEGDGRRARPARSGRPGRADQRARRPVVPVWVLAQAVGLAGTRLINLAVPWFVLVTTGDPALAGAVGLAQMAPLVLAKALSGPLIDRVGGVRVAVAADLASCVAVAAVPLLHAAGRLPLGVLFLVVAVEGALRGPGDAAKYSLCPRIAVASGRPLERITGYANTVDRLAGAVGAALGGLVVGLGGAPTALALSCVAFIGSAALVHGLLGPRLGGRAVAATEATEGAAATEATEAVEPAEAAEDRAEPYLRRLAEGWRFLRGDGVLLAITLMIAACNLLDQAFATILVPAWALGSGRGAQDVGLVFGVFAAAAVAGSLVAGWCGPRLPRLPMYVAAFLLAGLPRFVVLALDPAAALRIAVLVVGGFASGFINPIIGAVVFGRIPAHLVGRVSALNTALAWSLVPFGGLLGGLLVTWSGVTPALWATGVTYCLVTLAPLLVPTFRRLDDGRERQAASDSVQDICPAQNA